jgi:hypothetical protein
MCGVPVRMLLSAAGFLSLASAQSVTVTPAEPSVTVGQTAQ